MTKKNLNVRISVNNNTSLPKTIFKAFFFQNSLAPKVARPSGHLTADISVRFAHPDHTELNINGMVGTSDIS